MPSGLSGLTYGGRVMVGMKLKKEPILVAALIALLVLGFMLRNFSFTEGKLHEDNLPCKSTNDAFFHLDFGSWIIESQDARFVPPHWAEGRMGVWTEYTTVPYILMAGIAQFTNIPPYQVVFLTINLLAVFQVGVLFVLIRRLFSTEMALLASALALFPANVAWLFQQYIGFFFDVYSYLYVLVILFFLILFVKKPDWKTAALIGMFLAAPFYAHFVEVLFVLPFILVVCGFFFIKRKFDWSFFAKTAVIGLVFLLFSAYYVPVLMGYLLNKESFAANVVRGVNDKPAYFPEFTVPILFLALILIALALFFAVKHPKEKRIPRYILLAFIAYWFIVSKSHLLGVIAQRSYRQLMSGYGIFFVLAAFVIFFIVDLATKQLKMKSVRMPVILIITLIIVAVYFSPLKQSLAQINQGSFIDDDRWNAVSWVRDNTPQEARIFTLNGYLHSVGGKFSQRASLKGDLNMEYNVVNIQNICNALQQNESLPETYLGVCTTLVPTWGGKLPVERIALHEYRLEEPEFCDLPHYVTPEGEEGRPLVFPLEHVDYVLIQYVGTGMFIGQQPGAYDACMQWFVQKGQEEGKFSVVYPNNEYPNSKMAVLKVIK